MTGQDQPSPQPARQPPAGPWPVTPSGDSERPEGLAFDVAPGTDLTGVPVGDQTPDHPGAAHTEETVTESGDSIGLAIPGNQGTADAD